MEILSVWIQITQRRASQLRFNLKDTDTGEDIRYIFKVPDIF